MKPGSSSAVQRAVQDLVSWSMACVLPDKHLSRYRLTKDLDEADPL